MGLRIVSSPDMERALSIGDAIDVIARFLGNAGEFSAPMRQQVPFSNSHSWSWPRHGRVHRVRLVHALRSSQFARPTNGVGGRWCRLLTWPWVMSLWARRP